MIRELEINELNKLYKEHIKNDFPAVERFPCFIIKSNMKNNLQEGFIYVDENKEQGYAINSISKEAINISYFVIFKENRGRGLGTNFLKEIINHYNNKKVITVEVEKPENAKTEEEKIICEKRISFYEKLGFTIRKDINYSIFKLPMYLMVYSNGNLSKEEIIKYVKTIWDSILKIGFKHMLKID